MHDERLRDVQCTSHLSVGHHCCHDVSPYAAALVLADAHEVLGMSPPTCVTTSPQVSYLSASPSLACPAPVRGGRPRGSPLTASTPGPRHPRRGLHGGAVDQGPQE